MDFKEPQKENKFEKPKSDFLETNFFLPEDDLPKRWWHWGNKLEKRSGWYFGFYRRLENYFFKRIPNLSKIGGFLSLWLILVSLLVLILILQIRGLTFYHTQLQAVEGGIYTEGIVGQPTNFNPIYATTEVDKAVVRLVFANLFDYDENNQLQPVLAQDLQVDEKSQQYTLTLKPNLKWHDGQPITSDDVIFTIDTILNPQSQSPLRSNWEGVVLDKIDRLTVVFTLPASFSPFANNLNLPILPQHILGQEDMAQLRNAPFNYQPLGNGPFIFQQVVSLGGSSLDNLNSQDLEFKIQLSANPHWSSISSQQMAPLLDEFHFWVVNQPQRLVELFNQGLISGALGLKKEDITLNQSDYQAIDLKSMNGVYLFFKNSTSFFSQKKARQMMSHALNVADLLAVLPQSEQRIYGPLLPEHPAYDPIERPPVFNRQLAIQLLKDLDYELIKGQWQKDDRPLKLTLTTLRDTVYHQLALAVKKQLAQIDIQVILDLKTAEDMPQTLSQHDYGDLLIYGLNLGSDNDVYSYWHSSQISSNSVLRLNLAEYSSKAADEVLEAGRSRSQTDLQQQNYFDFQTIWRRDLPALALFRPRFTYFTAKNINSVTTSQFLIENSDRFVSIEQWSVLSQRVSLKNNFNSD